MSTESIALPAAAQPPDPAFAALRAKVYEQVGSAARALGCAPGTVSVGRDDDGRRHASMYFDAVNDAGVWSDWLRWAYATSNLDGQIVLTAYGQWLGFSWQFIASEPLVPVAAPAHREG